MMACYDVVVGQYCINESHEDAAGRLTGDGVIRV